MTKTGIALGTMWVVIIVCWSVGIIFLLQRDDQPKTTSFPITAQMPEDLDRLEAEVKAVCKQYANLDLSGMVKICKMVGYQE